MEKFRLSKSELLQSSSESPLRDLILDPACNSMLIEPWNAVATAANPLLKLVNSEDGISKLESKKLHEHKLLSSAWLVQNISSGLGSIIPYVVAGKCTGGLMRGVGSKLNVSGEFATLLKSDMNAQIVGAAIYDGMKDPRPGETRLGNSIGGAAAFTVFELGNASTKDLPLVNKIVMRAISGTVGASLQVNVADLISRNKLADKEKLSAAAVSGMVLNVMLPETQRGITLVLGKAATSIGIGIPIDRYVSQNLAQASDSATFTSIVGKNPWLYVQKVDKFNDFKSHNSLIELADATPEALARQVRRLQLSIEHERDFKRTVDSFEFRSLDETWDNYRNLRKTLESEAKHVENQIAFELNKSKHVLSSAEIADEIGAWPARDGNSQETQWRMDFKALLHVSRFASRINEPMFLTEAEKNLQSKKSESREEFIATQVVRELQKSGELALFAGGSVRDEIMGYRPKDYDIATSASPEKVESLFLAKGYKVLSVGKKFGTIKVVIGGETFEITTLRSDGSYSDGRRPDSVTYASSLREDAARRDLTINSMFKDPVNGVYYDLFNGKGDIDRKQIRAVGDPADRFAEDKLRMMRVPRFAARFQYEVEPRTLDAVCKNSEGLNKVSPERIKEELRGILAAQKPSIGLEIMMETGLMKQVLPEMLPMDGSLGVQDPQWHPEGNAWKHTKLVVDELARNGHGGNFSLMMSGLLHDIGKPNTFFQKADGSISNPRHEFLGAEMSREIAKRLKLSRAETARVESVVAQHMNMHNVRNMRDATLKEILRKPEIADLIEMQNADALGMYGADAQSHREFLKAKLDELNSDDLEKQNQIFDGHLFTELGIPKSSVRSDLRNAAREAEAAGAFRNREEAREWLLQEYSKIDPKFDVSKFGLNQSESSSDFHQEIHGLRYVGKVWEDVPVPLSSLSTSNLPYISFQSYESYRATNAGVAMTPLQTFKYGDSDLTLRYPSMLALYSRVELKDLANILAELPDPSLIKQVTVSDFPHIDEDWNTRKYGDDSRVVGETDSHGDIVLYRPENIESARRTLIHEYIHNMKTKFTNESDEFDKIVKSKPIRTFDGSGIFIDSADEAWARLGEGLMTTTPAEAILLAHLNPEASKVFLKSLKKLMDGSQHQSTNSVQLKVLIHYVETIEGN